MIVVIVVTSLDQNIALVPILPRLFKPQEYEIQKNRTDVSGHGGERERERKREKERERERERAKERRREGGEGGK